MLAPAGAAITYVTSLFDWSNHVFATKDYFNYTWSLSVEEQFYLLWPFALIWGYRRRPRLFGAFTLALIGVTLALDLYLGLSRAVRYDQHEYFGTDTNALPLLAGALFALALHRGWSSWTVRRVAPGSLMALALLPVLAFRNDADRPALVTIAVLAWLGHTLLGDVVWIAMFLVLAETSFRYVERPLRTRLASPRSTTARVRPSGQWGQ